MTKKILNKIQNGFSSIELLLVIGISALLAGIFIFTANAPQAVSRTMGTFAAGDEIVVGHLRQSDSANLVAAMVQAEMVVDEVNAAGGINNDGIPVVFAPENYGGFINNGGHFMMNKFNKFVNSVDVMTGTLFSSQATPASLVLAAANKPYGEAYATGDVVTQGKDDLVFRTTTVSTKWGRMAAQFAQGNSTAAVIHRADSFGEPIKDGFVDAFGGTVLDTTGFARTTDPAAFYPFIDGLIAGGVPDVVVGAWRSGSLKAFLEAWATKEAANQSLASVKFIHTGSVYGNYSSLSAAALTLLSTRSNGIQPWYDVKSKGYKAWIGNFGGTVLWDKQPRTYDATMIMMLAMAKGGAENEVIDADTIKGNYIAVSSPPGIKIYPGEFAKGRDMLAKGKDINYEGASGPVDLFPLTATSPDSPLEMISLLYINWSVDGTTGAPIQVGSLLYPL
jgi:ABC-type branched-subunit amino acid transport system substrate-binding protein